MFAHHRDQIDEVGDLLRGSSVKFLALSYPELWQEMVTRAPTSWVADHVSELRCRYDIPLKSVATRIWFLTRDSLAAAYPWKILAGGRGNAQRP